MKASEFIAESEVVQEIERLGKSGFEGGKEYLDREYSREKTVRPLPGGSGLLYSITKDGNDFTIKLWDKTNKGEYQPTPEPQPYTYIRDRARRDRDYRERLQRWRTRNAVLKADFDRAPGKIIGKLDVYGVSDSFPLKGAVQVGTITVDEDYRGMGLAKALYGIVLTIMKRPLLAGSSQTPGGRKNWLSLSQIPGVEMKGYVRIDDYDFKTYTEPTGWQIRHNKMVDKSIDTIMGQLGGQYIGKSDDRYYFAFDVKPNTTGKELQAYVDTNLSKVYGSYNSATGLYAVWTGR